MFSSVSSAGLGTAQRQKDPLHPTPCQRTQVWKRGMRRRPRRLSHSADSKPGKAMCPVVQQEVPNLQWLLWLAEKAQETQ